MSSNIIRFGLAVSAAVVLSVNGSVSAEDIAPLKVIAPDLVIESAEQGELWMIPLIRVILNRAILLVNNVVYLAGE